MKESDGRRDGVSWRTDRLTRLPTLLRCLPLDSLRLGRRIAKRMRMRRGTIGEGGLGGTQGMIRRGETWLVMSCDERLGRWETCVRQP